MLSLERAVLQFILIPKFEWEEMAAIICKATTKEEESKFTYDIDDCRCSVFGFLRVRCERNTNVNTRVKDRHVCNRQNFLRFSPFNLLVGLQTLSVLYPVIPQCKTFVSFCFATKINAGSCVNLHALWRNCYSCLR